MGALEGSGGEGAEGWASGGIVGGGGADRTASGGARALACGESEIRACFIGAESVVGLEGLGDGGCLIVAELE